jgi:predicted DNA-binding transcriptional regulator YafY
MFESVHGVGWRIRKEFFDDRELQMLIDALEYNGDISVADRQAITDKLSSFSSARQKALLSIESEQEGEEKNFSLLLNLRTINKAIRNEKTILFNYVDYDADPKTDRPMEVESTNGNAIFYDVSRKNTEYVVSPYKVMIHGQHYYLIGNFVNEEVNQIRYYRLDRMRRIRIFKYKYIDKRLEVDMDDYAKSVFSTKGTITLTLNFSEALFREMVSHFGDDFTVTKGQDQTYKAVITDVPYTGDLVNWILMLGEKVQILGPNDLKEEVKQKLTEAYVHYLPE